MWKLLTGLFQGSWQNYAFAFGAIVLAFLARKLLTQVVLEKLRKLSKGTATLFDDMVLEAIERPLRLLVVLLGLWLAVGALELPFGEHAALEGEAAEAVHRVLSVAWIVVFGWAGLNLCDVIGQAIELLTSKTETKLDDMLVPIVRRSLKLFVGLIAFILIVQNLGYSIGALLAGFSVGGVALALASQDTLQNFFGSVMIFVDRPFQVGDWIQTGSLEGVVEEVGMRSTRIRTFAKTLITVPNSKIAHEPINNFSRMPRRRVVEQIGIGYTTEPDRVEAVVNAFRMILREDERVDQSFWMVNFKDFGDSALVIYVYYFTKTTVWTEWMQTKQDINLNFMRSLETLGVEMAYPTRTLYLRQDAVPEKPPLEEALAVFSPAGVGMPTPASADDDDGGEG